MDRAGTGAGDPGATAPAAGAATAAPSAGAARQPARKVTAAPD
jgi:hypothetical protein